MSSFSYNKFSHIIKSISSFWYLHFRDASLSPHPSPIAKTNVTVLIFLNYEDFQFCILIISILYIFSYLIYYSLFSTV